jgi:hypothetical protein
MPPSIGRVTADLVPPAVDDEVPPGSPACLTAVNDATAA